MATIRDWLWERREQGRRQRAALRNFTRELEVNRRCCASNLMLLKTEAKDLAKGHSKGYVNALDSMEVDAWTLVQLNIPSMLLANAHLLGEIQGLLSIARRVNASLESRERFRIQHLEGDDKLLAHGLTRYAGILISPQEDLINRIQDIQSQLASYIRFVRC